MPREDMPIGGNMKTIKVLLVDDDEDFVATLSERIIKRNFESDFALSGEHAIELVHNQVPKMDLVLVEKIKKTTRRTIRRKMIRKTIKKKKIRSNITISATSLNLT